ncbi:MAG TPA: hypothetical protein VN176_07020 [Verrucomicrobiae bacterium]|jgi:tetratricopeptide (TPR) repeat protein|nr:hypothetical protein [Verrucomicrobiae bacterium]
MKKVLVTTVLALLAVSLAFGQASDDKKVIKDQAEYNSYMAAFNTTDPAAKGAAMEAFVKQYPQSVVQSDALEAAMGAYQQANNVGKIVELARRILALNPNHVRALAILTAVDRSVATNGGPDAPAALKEGCAAAQTGLQQLASWPKPAGVSDADFETARNQLADIFNGELGFCALQSKDFAGARTYYDKTYRLDPSNLQDLYQFAIADLEMTPMDLNGLWYCSKAIGVAQKMTNPQAAQGMVAYCKSKYKKYHGNNDGWDQLQAGAIAQSALPSDFATSIKPAPTPCDLAVQAVKDNPAGDLSFGDWEFILSKAGCSPANKDAADKVWAAIQLKEKNGEAKLKISVKVISATKEAIEAAITDENQQANKADVHIVLEPPPPPARGTPKPPSLPAAGSMTDIIGVLTSYTPDPFMFTMEKGELPEVKAKPPVHRPAAHKKAGR